MWLPEAVRQGKGHAVPLRVPHFVAVVDVAPFSDSSAAAPSAFSFRYLC